MRIEHQVDIAAPIDRVWELTIDVESWPQHAPNMNRVELLDPGPLTVGSRARIEQPGQPARVWTISQLDHQQRMVWWTRALGTTMTAGHLLEFNRAGTVNTLSVEIDGLLASFIGPLVRRQILGALTSENEGFKQAAESAG